MPGGIPTFVAAAGNLDIVAELRRDKDNGGRNYRAHLDGYDRTWTLTDQDSNARNGIFYFTEGSLAAVRIGHCRYRFTDQPQGWLGGTIRLDWPIITNPRLAPFERMGIPNGASGTLNFRRFHIHEFWRFVFLQQEVTRYAETFAQFPPMQRGASFTMEATTARIEAAMEKARAGHNQRRGGSSRGAGKVSRGGRPRPWALHIAKRGRQPSVGPPSLGSVYRTASAI